VPLRGAVLLNAGLDKCLMVKPWKGDKWTFPRGKINERESEDDCAVREVWEETGVDIKGRIVPNHHVQCDIYGTGTIVKLFLVPGISEEIRCGPNTRKEISAVGWVPLRQLPGWPGGDDTKQKFVDVRPFVSDLCRWVEEQNGIVRPRPSLLPRQRSPSPMRPALGTVVMGTVVGFSEEVAVRPSQQHVRNGRRSSGGAGKENTAEVATPGWLDIGKILRAYDQGWEEGEVEWKTKRGSSSKMRGRSPMVPAAPRNGRADRDRS